jgi:hypothetical protein
MASKTLKYQTDFQGKFVLDFRLISKENVFGTSLAPFIYNLPMELIENHFNLRLEDLVVLTRSSKATHSFLISNPPKIFEQVDFVPGMKKWLPYLRSVKVSEDVLKKIGYDVSIFSGIHNLDLSETNVVDASALGKVHTLNLSYTNAVNVSALGDVHTLDLSLTEIKDVSSLGNVHTLNLSDTLGKVHTLDLSYTQIFDVSALGKVHTLDLSYNYIEGVSALENVHTLNLKGTNVETSQPLVTFIL